jgi:hypothetical protein
MYRRVVHARDSLLGKISQPAGITRDVDGALQDIRYQELRNRDPAGISKPRIVKTASEREQVDGVVCQRAVQRIASCEHSDAYEECGETFHAPSEGDRARAGLLARKSGTGPLGIAA